MSGSCFLDTNIFVYSVDRSDPAKAQIAFRLIQHHAAARTGVISFQVVQEFFNVAFKRFPTVMASEDGFTYLATVLQPLFSVHSSTALYREALTLRERYQFSWYDSLIVAAAVEAKCSVLYTEDLQHGMKIDRLRVENPFRPK